MEHLWCRSDEISVSFFSHVGLKGNRLPQMSERKNLARKPRRTSFVDPVRCEQDRPLPTVVIGVDPGVEGIFVALSLVHDEGRIWPMTVRRLGRLTAIDMTAIIASLAGAEVLLLIEEVCGRGGWGAQANFTFGAVAGGVISAALGAGWRVSSITPMMWQEVVHAPADAHCQPKERTLRAYRRIFPGEPLPKTRQGNTNHNAIDALMVSFYGVTVLLGSAPRRWRIAKGRI